MVLRPGKVEHHAECGRESSTACVAQGEGAQIQQSMARSLIGGLISSTFITLFVVPVVYTLFHRKDAPR